VTHRLLSPALRELAEAAEYHESQQPGLGPDFLHEVGTAIERILRHPEAWMKLSPHTRRCRTHRFPHGVIYQIRGDEVLIVSVMDLRRHPDSWRDNL
jgi:hypothetical protein